MGVGSMIIAAMVGGIILGVILLVMSDE